MWTTVRYDEVKIPKYKLVTHTFNKTIQGKQYCSNCGIVRLNNSLTKWSIKMGCDSDLHPAYKSKCNGA